jgi:hypothetical protein
MLHQRIKPSSRMKTLSILRKKEKRKNRKKRRRCKANKMLQNRGRRSKE